ncbi:MAG: pyridoxamine 5'-phosphate oxidase family protein [Amnibacterium sp.]
MDTTRQAPADGPVAAGIERLTEEACWRLLGSGGIGRLAVRDGYDVDLFPVNFAALRGRIVLRTTHGTKLNALTVHPRVALEIDGEEAGELWSVVVKGDARTPELGTELQELHDLGLTSASPQAKSAYVVIEPVSVTGRRFSDAGETDPD